MRPVRVVHRCESYIFILTVEGCQHHVGRVDAVDVVWRESRVLLALVNRLLIVIVRDIQLLQNRGHYVLGADILVGLNTWKSEW